MVKLYPRVFSPYIQNKHNQTVIEKKLVSSRRPEKSANVPGGLNFLSPREIQMLEALMPLQSPKEQTIRAIMCYAKRV